MCKEPSAPRGIRHLAKTIVRVWPQTEGSSLKKRWVLGLGLVGSLLTVVSIAWEYARMRPDFGFIVEPWSIRGFETVHGAIAASVGVLALAAVIGVAWHGSERFRNGAAIVVGVALGATAITAAFGGDDYTVTPGFPVIALLTLSLGMVLFRLIGLVSSDSGLMRRFWFRQLVLIGVIILLAGALNAVIGGKTITMPQWAAIGVVFGVIAAMSLAPEPHELAANRMLMFSSMVGAIALAMSAGAVRSTLVRLQVEAIGVPAQYKDTQVTSGHLLAVFGMVLVFFAAVALWARRRDTILTAARAQRQRDAAEASAAEIRAALEHVTN